MVVLPQELRGKANQELAGQCAGRKLTDVQAAELQMRNSLGRVQVYQRNLRALCS